MLIIHDAIWNVAAAESNDYQKHLGSFRFIECIQVMTNIHMILAKSINGMHWKIFIKLYMQNYNNKKIYELIYVKLLLPYLHYMARLENHTTC